ncbi:MAG: TolC family protein [Bryobacterales bacterium]|nr:TolC family protein [Bryobacterales bacterium]
MRIRTLLLAIACVAGRNPLAAQSTLRLEDVLESVRRSYPPLLAALAERDIADAEVLASLGKFDLTLRARVDSDQLGYYRNERVYGGFEQYSQWNGASYYGGWRVGDGAFAPYDGKLDTRSYGEWTGGIKLPLIRDRAIDPRRAELRKAEIGRRLARLSIEQQQLLITQLATQRYWAWVTAGLRGQVQQALLDAANARDAFLRESARLGQIAAIEVTENARAIVQRKSQLVEAERLLQQTSIELSLFYRDAAGQPVIPTREQLPRTFGAVESLTEARMQQDLTAAIARRPELQRLEAAADQLRIDSSLARNDQRPAIDLQAGYTAASGSAGTVRRGPQELKAALVFELPFQRRAATGKLQAAEAKLKQVDQRERFTRDQIEAEVRDAASAVRNAHDRVQLLRDEVRLARDLDEADRARFQLGDGTLFLVNLREQATADAAQREISATSDYFRATAQYEFAVAQALAGPRP